MRTTSSSAAIRRTARNGTPVPGQVRLTFDEPVRAGYDTISVIGPNGEQWAAGPARVEDSSVIAPVRELGPAGTYAVRFRILSNDGHPVTGKVTFT